MISDEDLESMDVSDQILGHYQVLEMIAKGGMGVVYRANHINLKRVVALKVLPPSRLNKKMSLLRFQREVEILASMSHPNIATAYDSGTSGEIHYLAMELVEGQSLKSLVNNSGPLDVAEALPYIRQVALGLAYAHKRGIIHRDIKPSNLMVTKDGVVKILDLGVARMADSLTVNADNSTIRELTSQMTFVGTAEYASPEQATDASSVSSKSDLYSLGCTLHFLLTGRPIFRGKSTMEFLMNHQSMPRPSLRKENREIPRSVDRLLQKMIAISPERRYASMEEFIEALDAISLTDNPRFSRKQLGIGLTIALACIVAFFVWDRNGERLAPKPAAEVVVDPPFSDSRWTYGLDLVESYDSEPEKYAWINLVLATDDGKSLVIAGGRNDPVLDGRHPVTIRNLSDWSVTHEFRDPESWIWSGAKSREGDRLLVGTGGSFNEETGQQLGGNDYAVYVWDLKDPQLAPLRIAAHQKKVSAAACLVDDRIVAGDANGILRMFDSIDGEVLREFENPYGEVYTLAVSPSGRTFATGHYDQVAIWDPAISVDTDSFAFNFCKALAYSPGGEILAVAGLSETIDLWDLKNRKVTDQRKHGAARVNSLAYCLDGNAILAGHDDGKVTLWDLRTNELVQYETPQGKPIKSLSIAPDKRSAYTAGDDGVIRLWNLSSMRKSD